MATETTEERVNVVLSILIVVFAVPANSLVLFTFYTYSRLRTINNLLIINLAIVDFLRCTIFMPVKIYNALSDDKTDHPTACSVIGVLSATNYLQSAAVLASIAMLRYLNIVRPAFYARFITRRRVIMYCVGMVFVLFAIAMLPALGVGVYQYSKYHGLCFTTWEGKNLIFRIFFYIVTVAIAMPVMLWSYIRIFMVIQKHKRSILPRLHARTVSMISRATVDTATQVSRDTPDLEGAHSIVPTTVQVISSSREINVTKVMFAMVMTYVVSWTPAVIITVLLLVGYKGVPSFFLYLIVTVVESKSFWNALIYSLGNRQFLQAIKGLRRKILHPRRQSTASTKT